MAARLAPRTPDPARADVIGTQRRRLVALVIERPRGIQELAKLLGFGRKHVYVLLAGAMEAGLVHAHPNARGQMTLYRPGPMPAPARVLDERRDFASQPRELAPGHVRVEFGDRWRPGRGVSPGADPRRVSSMEYLA